MEKKVEEAIKYLRNLIYTAVSIFFVYIFTISNVVNRLENYEKARHLYTWLVLKDFTNEMDLVFRLGSTTIGDSEFGTHVAMLENQIKKDKRFGDFEKLNEQYVDISTSEKYMFNLKVNEEKILVDGNLQSTYEKLCLNISWPSKRAYPIGLLLKNNYNIPAFPHYPQLDTLKSTSNTSQKMGTMGFIQIYNIVAYDNLLPVSDYELVSMQNTQIDSSNQKKWYVKYNENNSFKDTLIEGEFKFRIVDPNTFKPKYWDELKIELNSHANQIELNKMSLNDQEILTYLDNSKLISDEFKISGLTFSTSLTVNIIGLIFLVISFLMLGHLLFISKNLEYISSYSWTIGLDTSNHKALEFLLIFLSLFFIFMPLICIFIQVQICWKFEHIQISKLFLSISIIGNIISVIIYTWTSALFYEIRSNSCH